MQVLLIEDEEPIAEEIREGLEEQHFRVDIAADGLSGLKKAEAGSYAVILLDVMLPGISGWEVCQRLRASRNLTPILMLTACETPPDRVRGLELGADDYLPKPFDFSELVARVRALQRRDKIHRTRIIRIADLVIDTGTRRVFRENGELNLTDREYTLLEALASHEGRALSREFIQERIWGHDEALASTVDAWVHLLRKKIDTGRMLRPVREVTRTAAQLGAKDLSQRLVVSGQDEFSELATTFNGMLERLETSFERQRRFTGDASHELRTPLTVIKSVASRFLSRKDLPEDYRRGIERLDHAAGMMERVVQDMLLLARSDTGQLVLQLSPIRLSTVLEEALACVPLESGPTLRYEASDSSLIVSGDASHLTRLFSNLLDNAVRHTPSEGCITISAYPQGDCALVRVVDTGIGISPEHLSHLTERFYRIDTARARAHGGTGLGLAICQSIVEAHGGTMQIESTLGLGTSVTVMLPLT